MEKNAGYNPVRPQEVAFECRGDNKLNPRCLCTNTGCARHSNCKACMEFHRLTAHPPTCRYAWHWAYGKDAEIIK